MNDQPNDYFEVIISKKTSVFTRKRFFNSVLDSYEEQEF